jgi:hypothetical protein
MGEGHRRVLELTDQLTIPLPRWQSSQHCVLAETDRRGGLAGKCHDLAKRCPALALWEQPERVETEEGLRDGHAQLPASTEYSLW